MKRIATIVAIVAFLVAPGANALEKTREAVDDGEYSDWSAGATCTVLHYNFCTGWVFNWSGWADGDVVGQVYDSCCNGASELLLSNLRIRDGAPAGYGFTGTISVSAADANDCPTTPIMTQAYLPTEGWQIVNWGAPVPSRFIVSMVLADAGIPSPVRLRTDHPSAGPSGPEACGNCYPTTRVNHSFSYGTTTSPLCPGSPFDDAESVCDAELVWEQVLACTVSIEDESWSKVKSLYR